MNTVAVAVADDYDVDGYSDSELRVWATIFKHKATLLSFKSLNTTHELSSVDFTVATNKSPLVFSSDHPHQRSNHPDSLQGLWRTRRHFWILRSVFKLEH